MKLEARVSQNYDILNPNDLIIWNYIYQHKQQCMNMSIDALAKLCNVSRSTVMRFAQKIGMSGYGELKACLHLEMKDSDMSSTEHLCEIVCESNIKAIQYYQRQNYDSVCSLLYNAKRIFLYGTGQAQRSVCGEFRRMMISLNILVLDVPADGELMKIIKMMTPEDVILIVSKSGEGESLRNIMFELNSRGIPSISLTKYGNNTLSRMSTEKLFVNIEELAVLDETNFVSMTLMFLMMEIVFTKFVEYKKSRE